jgi:(1->4)-alpha-D-glucan 1-alpha-D-glucosylmutase
VDAAEAERADLRLLCRRHGIGTEYFDIWGRRREVPERGLRALLRAMAVPAADAADVRAGLRAADAADAQAARRPLPPVVAFFDDVRPWVLPLAAATPAAHWRLVEEGGRCHEGALAGGEVKLPADLALGYHRLELLAAPGAPALCGPGHAAQLLAAPRRCYLPPPLAAGARAWGPALQLYALRSGRNWGIGDFTDLKALVERCGRAGAAMVGLNPLHALFPDHPSHASPYSPSSRQFGNPLYLDVEAVAEFETARAVRSRVAGPEFQARLRDLRAAELVDYPGVAAAKREVLDALYEEFRVCHLEAPEASPRARAFRQFQQRGGAALRRHALFEALQERHRGLDASVYGWTDWPPADRDPGAPEVAAFLAANLARVEFFEYLQWQFEEQLAAVARAASDAGLAIGLYADLAVSIDRGGADAWSGRDLYALEAGAGCPPDDFNLKGQDWGLLPLLPEPLRACAYAPFVATLRANMRHAGALRIDHVMGLSRLFWVPRGDLPEAGAYVDYPFEHLLAIVALESHRQACMIVGEDLGTVPDEVRRAMDRGGLLSYRVLYFSRRDDGAFLAPAEFPREALVTATTHDLATLAGYWEGRDIERRRALQLFPDAPAEARFAAEREHDRPRLVEALRREGLLPDGADAAAPMDSALAGAVQSYLARSPARLLSVQLEDIFGCRDQVNLPGTVDEYPNWRRKLPLALEEWEADGRFDELARRMADEGRG